MEANYANVDSRTSTKQTGLGSSQRRFHGALLVFLGLLSVFLLAGLIGLGVHYHSVRSSAEDISVIIDNLTERLQDSNNKLSSMSEERDLLLANLTEITKEMEKLQSLSAQNRICPAGWRMFRSSCYLLSSESGSWSRGRQDCREKGADLVVIDSTGEQTFLSTFTEVETWIGLTDRDEEGTWKWIDGTPLTLRYWTTNQPDNGGGDPQWGEEDCAHIRAEGKTGDNWNDRSCNTSLRWICEKNAGV
ncbi:CD209 antigen-like protein C isoform X1 [Thunnus maccoyii]|uniref:CD209 antigen-like protein C isoform X1 n=1 Tax=Thunnus maccoyii TaxID=8240 RepID=UPI001C4BD435|nr:CD209 antigen-like protein C isoform X1 [Thunnus maccoyii]XP_042281477.1 CD209 antigen-like protein C isoform X1 [Thunnus maccoyii]